MPLARRATSVVLRLRPELFGGFFAFGTVVEATPSTSPTRLFLAATAGFLAAGDVTFLTAVVADFAIFFAVDTAFRTIRFGIR